MRRDAFDDSVDAQDLGATPHNVHDTAASPAAQARRISRHRGRLLGHESAANEAPTNTPNKEQ